jgi:DNA-binding transcriptional ArsR family regulator
MKRDPSSSKAKDEWMSRMLALKNPLAVRIMSAAVAFLDVTFPDVTAESLARRIALAAALGCTLDELRAAEDELIEAGLIEDIGKGWLQ